MGLPHYAGKPCRKAGHQRRFTATAACMDCAAAWHRNAYHTNPEHLAKMTQKNLLWAKSNRERHNAVAERFRARTLGIPIEMSLDAEVERRIAFRDKVCEVCGVSFDEDNKPWQSHTDKYVDGGKHSITNTAMVCRRCHYQSIPDYRHGIVHHERIPPHFYP